MRVHMYKHRYIHTYLYICMCVHVSAYVFVSNMFSEILFPVGRFKDMNNPPMNKSVTYSSLLKPNFTGDI